MPRKKERLVGTRRYRDFNEDSLRKAMEELRKGTSARKVSEKFNIPRTTLQRHFKGQQTSKVGRPYVLSSDDEKILSECVALCADWGFPLTSFDLRLIVKSYFDRRGIQEKRFRNNLPGKDWARSFLARHKDNLTVRLSENIKRSRANVDEEVIKKFFKELQTSLDGVASERILNYDETSMSDDPGRCKIIARKSCKHPEKIMDTSKNNVSVMFSGSASGILLPPYIVYKAEHLYDSWTSGGPTGARYNRSKNSWFNMPIFEDWFNSIAMPYFRNFEDNEPKVLIGDNLASHISVNVISECMKRNIRFVLLPPNSTHLCQPLDVAFFKPLKSKWRAVLLAWKNKNRGSVPKDVFPRLLKQTLKDMDDNGSTRNNLIAGFKSTGICPLNQEEVLKRLPTVKSIAENGDANGQQWAMGFQEFLIGARQRETAPLRRKKSRLSAIVPGKSVEDSMLKTSNMPASIINDNDGKNPIDASNKSNKQRKLTNDILESDDSSLCNSEYSLHDSSTCFDELSDAEMSDVEVEVSREISYVPSGGKAQEMDIAEGSFAIVSFLTEGKRKRKRQFIGQIIEKSSDFKTVTVKFLRNFSKCKNVYVFPTVDDISVVKTDQIVEIVNPVHSRRGRFTFPYELL